MFRVRLLLNFLDSVIVLFCICSSQPTATVLVTNINVAHTSPLVLVISID